MTEKTINRIVQKYNNNITGINDLLGDSPPSALFGILANVFSYVLSNDVSDVISPLGVQARRVIHPLITTFGKLFLTYPQVIENRNFLLNPQADNIPKDNGITLPSEPVIWVANHGFKMISSPLYLRQKDIRTCSWAVCRIFITRSTLSLHG